MIGPRITQIVFRQAQPQFFAQLPQGAGFGALIPFAPAARQIPMPGPGNVPPLVAQNHRQIIAQKQSQLGAVKTAALGLCR